MTSHNATTANTAQPQPFFSTFLKPESDTKTQHAVADFTQTLFQVASQIEGSPQSGAFLNLLSILDHELKGIVNMPTNEQATSSTTANARGSAAPIDFSSNGPQQPGGWRLTKTEPETTLDPAVINKADIYGSPHVAIPHEESGMTSSTDVPSYSLTPEQQEVRSEQPTTVDTSHVEMPPEPEEYQESTPEHQRDIEEYKRDIDTSHVKMPQT